MEHPASLEDEDAPKSEVDLEAPTAVHDSRDEGRLSQLKQWYTHDRVVLSGCKERATKGERASLREKARVSCQSATFRVEVPDASPIQRSASSVLPLTDSWSVLAAWKLQILNLHDPVQLQATLRICSGIMHRPVNLFWARAN